MPQSTESSVKNWFHWQKRNHSQKRYTPCHEQSATRVFGVQIMMASSAYRYVSRYTIQNSTLNVKMRMFPNHGSYGDIYVPLKSITCNNVPCSKAQPHKNYTNILQEQIVEHFPDFVTSASQMRNITAKWRYFCMTFKPILPRRTPAIVGQARSPIENRYANTLLIYIISKTQIRLTSDGNVRRTVEGRLHHVK